MSQFDFVVHPASAGLHLKTSPTDFPGNSIHAWEIPREVIHDQKFPREKYCSETLLFLFSFFFRIEKKNMIIRKLYPTYIICIIRLFIFAQLHFPIQRYYGKTITMWTQISRIINNNIIFIVRKILAEKQKKGRERLRATINSRKLIHVNRFPHVFEY